METSTDLTNWVTPRHGSIRQGPSVWQQCVTVLFPPLPKHHHLSFNNYMFYLLFISLIGLFLAYLCLPCSYFIPRFVLEYFDLV